VRGGLERGEIGCVGLFQPSSRGSWSVDETLELYVCAAERVWRAKSEAGSLAMVDNSVCKVVRVCMS
jgi:hypothetical protein